jgi:hypothetical protein
MGLLGLGLFLCINFATFTYGWQYITRAKTEFNKSFLIGSLGALVVWHTAALFFDVIESPPTSIFLWILIGAVFSVIAVDEKIEYARETVPISKDLNKDG